MALIAGDVIDQARDSHRLFTRANASHKMLLRWLSGLQNDLIVDASEDNPSFFAQQIAIAFDDTIDNAPGTAGVNTSGGTPADAGSLAQVQQTSGDAVTFDPDAATIILSDRVVSAATANTVDIVGAFVVNAYAGKYAYIPSGKGYGASNLRLILSNTVGGHFVLADDWEVTPDATSLLRIVDPEALIDGDFGVVTSRPQTATRVGYVVKLDSAGVAYIDLTTPLVATFRTGIPLPAFVKLIGADVRWTEGSDKAQTPLRILDYANRYLKPIMGQPCAYVEGGQLYLCGDPDDWHYATSIDLRLVPVLAAVTALTDTLLVPDNGEQVLISGLAASMARRLAADPVLGQGLDASSFVEEARDDKRRWLKTVVGGQRPRSVVSRIKAVV